MKLKQKGFTLIELLVVISIIALLASIILAALNTSIDRAHIAAGEQFADQVYHTAGDAIIGDWEFDDCSGTTAKDSSGNGNTGTLNGFGTSPWSSNTPNSSGCSLSFPTSGSPYVSTITSFPTPGPQQFTISVWFKTSSPPSNGGNIVGFGQTQSGSGNYDRQIYMGNDGKIYFGIWYTTLWAPETVSSLSNLADGKWHNAVGTDDGSNEALYIDGVLQGTLSAYAIPQSYAGYWRVGGVAGGSPWPKTNNGYFNGLVDGVRIYNKFLAP